MNPYAIIFDMDGVICHTNPYHSDAFKTFFDKRQIPYTEQELRDHMFGKHNSYILSYFMKREIAGEELLMLEQEKESLFREIYADHVETIPSFMTLLEELKKASFKTGVATSAPYANLELIMGKLGFESLMESTLSSENVSKHKPDPEVYLKSAENLAVDPSNCLVFEDSYSGVTAARNAGMKVVGVLSSHTKEELPPCQFYIHDYHDIDMEKLRDILLS
ncbi:HAD family hydrolase [Olivibacter sitiensis]|uniref:HAD family hydrolase n=1 Tax=Olivibacter sitiensis TaxID=376470 RepID=UPI000421BBE8|nr:HAD family phosphatase [Olivibacter sitiensis]